MTHPTAFLGAPALHPGPTPAQPYEPGVYAPARVVLPRSVPTPMPEARLSIRPESRRGGHIVTLTKALLLAIPPLRGSGPVELVPPVRRGGTWHLDTRPTAARRLPAPGRVARFAIPALPRELLVAPVIDARPGQRGGAQGGASVSGVLRFALGPEVAGAPGYFELLPLR